MSRLYEWKQMNNNTSNNNSSASSSSTSNPSTGYKNRLSKLADYAGAHMTSTAINSTVELLSSHALHYKEYHRQNGKEFNYSIIINLSRFDDKWTIKHFLNDDFDCSQKGEGYEDLLRALAFYMNTPHYGTPEYNNLLVESLTETAEDFKTYETMWD